MNCLSKRGGFTLVELMVVVAILSVLGAIAITKADGLIDRANDARTKGNLGVLRSALTVYYADTEGVYPGFASPHSQPAGYGPLLHNTLVPKYLTKIPEAAPSRKRHRISSDVYLVWNLSGNQDNEPASGYGWVYDANPFDDIKPSTHRGLWGTIRVLCTHQDSKGVNWASY